jgi:hypothetical protein
MAKASKQPARQMKLVDDIRAAVREIESLAPTLSKVASKRTREMLHELRAEVDRAFSSLDPVKEPTGWFDPADPDTAGRLVAVALLAQPRVSLELIPRSYGAGVYAIYYNGDYPAYAPISSTESPIYVGKADPASGSSKTPREQGEKLYGRLADHRKMIRTVSLYAIEENFEHALRIEDFECRRLVTATNAQMFAERHLIDLFKPLWNKETNVCWGISKHGDTEGRSNDRSPWDVLHPGRKWAMAEKLEDSRSRERILRDIAAHFAAHPAFGSREEIIERFLEAFAQNPMVSATPVVDDEVATEDIFDEDASSS